jgi:hypothetical protein
MRLPILINVSASLCALYSVLHLVSVAVLTYTAPGYFANLRGGPRFQILVLAVISFYGLGTAAGLFRRAGWARIAIQPLAIIWMCTAILSMWGLAHTHASAPQYIASALLFTIAASWLVLFNVRRTKACFTR